KELAAASTPDDIETIRRQRHLRPRRQPADPTHRHTTRSSARRAEQEVIRLCTKNTQADFLELGAVDLDKADIGLYLTGQRCLSAIGQQWAGQRSSCFTLHKQHALMRRAGTAGP